MHKKPDVIILSHSLTASVMDSQKVRAPIKQLINSGVVVAGGDRGPEIVFADVQAFDDWADRFQSQEAKSGAASNGNSSVLHYVGRLDYENYPGDVLDVTDFIVRESRVMFEVTSLTEEYGPWSARGVALQIGSGLFRTMERVRPMQQKVPGDSWMLEFAISPHAEGISVQGTLEELGGLYRFAGVLTPRE